MIEIIGVFFNFQCFSNDAGGIVGNWGMNFGLVKEN
jgi:hypothetical protein